MLSLNTSENAGSAAQVSADTTVRLGLCLIWNRYIVNQRQRKAT
jgi:hypothetical protein